MKVEDVLKNKESIALIRITKFNAMVMLVDGTQTKLDSKAKVSDLNMLISNELPIIDFSSLSGSIIDKLAVMLPIPSLLPEPAPYGPMSTTPLSVFATIAKRVGASVYNVNSVNIYSHFFKKDVKNELEIFSLMMKKEITTEEARERSTLDLNHEEVENKILSNAPDVIHKAWAKIKEISSISADSQLVKDYSTLCIGAIHEAAILYNSSKHEVDLSFKVAALNKKFKSLIDNASEKEVSIVNSMSLVIQDLFKLKIIPIS